MEKVAHETACSFLGATMLPDAMRNDIKKELMIWARIRSTASEERNVLPAFETFLSCMVAEAAAGVLTEHFTNEEDEDA